MSEKKICPFFPKCGGCLYQDLPEDVYLAKKRDFIKRAFADHGLQVEPEDVISVPVGTRRRASFAFQHGHIGYNAFKSHQIIDITECCLLTPAIVIFLPTLRTWIKELDGKGDVFILATEWGLDIHIKTATKERPNLKKRELFALWGSHPDVVRLTYNHEPIIVKTPLPLAPDAFLQPSKEGEETLINLMLSDVSGARKAVDLFCGCGTFTRPLLTAGITVTGYDCAADSVQLLGSNGIVRDLFRAPLLPDELKDVDLVVIDPPRAGAKAQIEQIAQTNVPNIVMISCYPPTAARDARILTDAGWQLKRVVPVDQFTWSNHIEIVCFFHKK